MAPDAGLVAAIVAEVMRSSDPGTKVLFTTDGAATADQRETASAIATRAGLAEWSGWALVSTSCEPSLATALDDLAGTGRSPGAMVVSLDGRAVSVPEGHGDGLDVAVLELGS